MAWWLGAVWCRGYDAVDVVSVAGVLAICDRCCDERLSVRDTWRLGEVDHFVGNVLLVTDATCGKKRVDAIQARELYARLVREDITPTVKLYNAQYNLVRRTGRRARGRERTQRSCQFCATAGRSACAMRR